MQMITFLLLAMGILAMLGLIFAYFIPAKKPLKRLGIVHEIKQAEETGR